MLFGAALLAVLVFYSFPYGWTWVQCLLFGAAFSATDPVAVIAVFKEVIHLGVPRCAVDLNVLCIIAMKQAGQQMQLPCATSQNRAACDVLHLQ